VHIDPDSPTGQEYDIPLERARRQASSRPGVASQSSRSSSDALFGEGIEPADGADAADGSREQAVARSRGASKADGRRRHHSARGTPAAVRAAINEPGAPSGGIGATLLIGGFAAVILTVGVVGGVALRRRRD
jgi:hypothetical protein